MELLDAIRTRRTTNGYFKPDPVSREHQHLLIEAASRAPSHFNSQPWRFVLIDDEAVRFRISDIAGRTMTQLIDEGKFFARYKKYFRFTHQEMEERRDGIFIDQLPPALRPFIKHMFTDTALSIMRSVGVPKILGADNTKLVAASPLLLAALLKKDEYIPGELSALYCILSLGMAIENIWLTTCELGMGMQFISTPMEIPEAWEELKMLLCVPDDLELMAIYRLGYLPEQRERPRIDWTSNQRKTVSQLAFRNTCQIPENDV
ncbi:MAG: nitroreductase family protein [Bacteroidota bacterium]|nr:nitroreductase family protein [Candidatus Kapabacteria bacterium]MDW8219002.1 nitroreductase family protein [Bacteroidota bacterium]